VVYPWSLHQKKWFREKHFVPLLDAAEQVFIIIFCSLFFFFFPLPCKKCFSSLLPNSTKEGKEKGRGKKRKKRVQRTIQGLEPVLIFGNVRIKSPFTTTKKEGENGGKKELPFGISFWWKYSVKQNTGVLLPLFFFFPRIFYFLLPR
jgi:hypothetical protein